MGYEDIIRDIESGLTYDQISQKYRVSNSTISRIAKEHGLVKRAKRTVVEKQETQVSSPYSLDEEKMKDFCRNYINDKIEEVDFRQMVPNYFLAAVRLMVSIVKKQYARYMKNNTAIRFAVEYLENYLEAST